MKRIFCTAAMAAALSFSAAAQDLGELDETSEPTNESISDDEMVDGEMAEEEEQESDSAPTYNQERMATLRALDKITGRSIDFEIEVGKPVVYGVLEVDLKACFQTPPEEPPESAAFLQIHQADYAATNTLTEPRLVSDVQGELDASTAPYQPTPEAAEPLFSGWMFASSPGLSALEHPVYDVWVIRCTQPSPESLSSPASPDE
ncbi:DUF2155 domain-containing protein [Henriciella marina]|uniref:DUF2155 domain-containing protein n=1 Tax=Henriciella marina TaxID=453851 RepID=UPI00035CFE35|nr:DUF2155 domain-containing protein [Henriciella marina]